VDRKRAMDRLLGAPFVQQGLKVDYTTYVVSPPIRGSSAWLLSLTTDLPCVRAQHDRAESSSWFATCATATSSRPAPTRFRCRRRGCRHADGQGGVRVQFDAPAGSFLMRAVVREPGGLSGSADRRFDVRALDGPASPSAT